MWVAVGMALAVLPLALSAVVGYIMLDRGVIAAFQDVAARQREQINPTQRLQLMLWEAAVPLNLYLDAGDPEELAAFCAARQRIEAGFARLHEALASTPDEQQLVERASADWNQADHVATEVISVRRSAGDSHGVDLAQRFDGLLARATDKLGAVYEALAVDLKRDHDVAIVAYERSQWIAGIAAGVSVLLVLAGIAVIGRFMLSSIDRLVEGVTRFAAGDRDHRIEVRVPPELRRVAAEFNRMIERVQASENALADQARRDAMTGLLNRRAFDEALYDASARMRRLGEKIVLLILDLDHFKQINDTYGHSAGDDVLRATARAVTSSVREIDKAFRIGGEEFAVLLQGADTAAITATAERLRIAIMERPVAVARGLINVTVSIGVAMTRQTGEAEALFAAADAALYRAKAEGRNRIIMAGDQEWGNRPRQ